jgi:hypothetical protein
MRGAAASALVLASVLATAACTATARTISIGTYSQADSPSRASIGASVHAVYRSPAGQGRMGSSTPASASLRSDSSTPPAIGGAVDNVAGIETLPRSAPILRDATPLGPGSFWMNVNGQRCIYAPSTNGTCFNVAPGAAGPGARPIDPRVLAAAAARRLSLLPGQIVASPSRQTAGLTGAPSWFWLDPAPASESLTVSGGGEQVTVTAVPSRVRWAFGDGEGVDGGPGRPYARRATRAGSIQHVYRTRCLPGDQGHDPYVLASCNSGGYQVGAGVEWTISFQAAGPIATAGVLPSRTTSTGIAYPVGEVRGFLSAGGAAR